MKKQLNVKTAVLTGASGGIGRAIAKTLSDRGAQLVLVARDEQKLNALRDELGGEPHMVVAADLATGEGRDELVAVCRQFESGIDLLINNAGINEFGVFEEQSQSAIEKLIQINLLSPILVCQDLLSFLGRAKSARIINIGSTFGSIGYPGFSTYCASKFGLRGFTEALRRELADSTTQVSYIAPRATRTAINSESVVAMNRKLGTAMDDPRRVAREVLRVINRSDYTDEYIGWPEKLFVRLNALLPGLVDRSLHKQLPTILGFARHSDPLQVKGVKHV